MKGIIKSYDIKQGFGFIIPEDDSEGLFFYKKDLLEDVSKDDKVQFEKEKGLNGYNAKKIEKI